MTVTMKPRVECNGCSEERQGDDGQNAIDFRRELTESGWANSTGNGPDFCPACVRTGRAE